MKLLLMITFTAGAALFWFQFLRFFKITRSSRFVIYLEKISQQKNRLPDTNLLSQNLSSKEKKFKEQARLAELPSSMTLKKFNLLRFTFVSVMVGFAFYGFAPARDLWTVYSVENWVFLFIVCFLVGVIVWWIPMLIVVTSAKGKRNKYLIEISKFSHRLSLSLTNRADLREMIIRASRTLKLLKPDIQEMITLWGKGDHRAAIARFQERVGISEVFPLVNALQAAGDARSEDIVQVLKDQTQSIEDVLEAEVEEQLEKDTLKISTYILIPFTVIVVLFLYPWVITTKNMIDMGFSP